MAERRDDRSSEEIRRDIEGTRTELRDTVDALERKLSLGQVVDEVWGRFGGRQAAGDAASSLGDTIRHNPVPLALMGLGVAWLAVDKATGSDRNDAERRRSGRGTNGRKGMASDMASKAKGLASDAKDKMADAKNSLGSSNGEAGSNGETYGWEGSGRSDGMSDRAMKGARRGVKKAKHGLRAAMDEQPLALGAVAFGLGLASGLSVPITSWEDETMGEAADAVKEEAGSMAKDVTRDVKQVAASAGSAAKDEAERKTGQVKDAASSVASEAKHAAKDEMRNRDLDSEGMKNRAKETHERTQDRLAD